MTTGGVVHDTEDQALHGVSWARGGSTAGSSTPAVVQRMSSKRGKPQLTMNPSHYVDYQD